MTYIVGLRQLADFIERSRRFDQDRVYSCTIGHAFQLSGDIVRSDNAPLGVITVLGSSITGQSGGVWVERAAALLGISMAEANAIWVDAYPNRATTQDSLRPTQAIAVEHLRQLADKYEPCSPITARPVAELPVEELAPMPSLARELVPA